MLKRNSCHSGGPMQEEYDLERVTATLQAMEARRRRRQQFPATCDFDLAPAELSSGGSDDSDDGQSDSTSSLPSDGDGSPQHSRVKQKRGRGRTRQPRIKDSLDLSMSALSLAPAEERSIGASCGLDKELAPTQDKRVAATASKASRIPRLVQQRRQLNAVPERTALTRDKISNQTRSPRVGELGREALSSSDAKALLNQPVSHLIKSRTDSRDEPVAIGESIVALSSAVSNAATEPETSNSGSALSSGSPSVSKSLAPAMLYYAKSPTHDVTRSGQPNFSQKLDGRNTSSAAVGNVSDELDSTSAEERELLRSLEKLDRRLTNVSAVPPAVGRGSDQLQTQSDQVNRLVSSNREGSRLVRAAEGEIDEETLRAAAYGGGTHCKLRQPAPMSVRSSSVKRAELSTGIHKARVRLGGALIHDTDRNVDGTGKHKVVVKKDLAHLLI